MSMIEGFGDEVTIFFGILLVFLVISLAWISTNIRDIPFFSIFIIELRQGRRRGTSPTREGNTETEPVNETVQSSNQEHLSSSSSSSNEQTDEFGVESNTTNTANLQSGIQKTSAEINCEENIEVTQEGVVTKDSSTGTFISDDDHTNIIEEESIITNQTEALGNQQSDLSETELRNRRVNFYSKQKSEGLIDSRTTVPTSEIQELSNVRNLSATSENDSQKVKSSLSTGSQPTCSSGDNTSSQSSKPKTNENTSLSNAENIENVTNTSTENETTRTGDAPRQRKSEAEISNEQITVRLKYLNDTQRNVTASLEDTIGQFRRANFAAELSENKLIRFIFNGQVLRNDSNTLQGYNIADNSVIHCLITQAVLPNSTPRHDEDAGFDIGMLMLPIFGLIICFVWYLRFEYRQFFTATSTISLIGVTFLFIAAVLASWEGHRRGQRAHEHVE